MLAQVTPEATHMIKNIIKLGMASAFLMSSLAIASAQGTSDKMQNNKTDTTKAGTATSKDKSHNEGKQGG
jgi:hypothetical protein